MSGTKRFAVLRGETVDNVIVWDGESDLGLEPDETALSCPDTVSPGWSYRDGTWVAPPPPTDEAQS